MDMLHDMLIGARRPMERHEQETPGIKRGESGGDHPHPEGVIADTGTGGIGRLDDQVLGIETREEG